MSGPFVRKLGCLLVFGLLLGTATASLGDVVVPADRVVNGVNIREEPTTESRILGLLRPGEQLEHLGSVPRWHRVRLSGGESGFVSTAWSQVVHVTPEAPSEPEPIGAPDEPAPAGTTPGEPEDVGVGLAEATGGVFDFWISEALIQKLATQNTLLFPMRLTLTARSRVHSLSSDCEIHIAGIPVDAEDLAAPPAVVVEPPNLCKNSPPGGGRWEDFVDQNILGKTCTVLGFPRIYDEHLVGDETPTNPHHMLEIHPALKIECGDAELDASTFIAYHEGMSEIKESSAAKCFDSRLWVRRNESQSRYEFRAKRAKRCGNFASFELSVFTEWIRELSGAGGHSALVRVRVEGLGFRTLKIYTYPGTEADDLLHGFHQGDDPHHGAFLHGMLTFDYFSVLKVVRDRNRVFLPLPEWTEVPFPLALVAMGPKRDPDPEEHD